MISPDTHARMSLMVLPKLPMFLLLALLTAAGCTARGLHADFASQKGDEDAGSTCGSQVSLDPLNTSFKDLRDAAVAHRGQPGLVAVWPFQVDAAEPAVTADVPAGCGSEPASCQVLAARLSVQVVGGTGAVGQVIHLEDALAGQVGRISLGVLNFFGLYRDAARYDTVSNALREKCEKVRSFLDTGSKRFVSDHEQDLKSLLVALVAEQAFIDEETLPEEQQQRLETEPDLVEKLEHELSQKIASAINQGSLSMQCDLPGTPDHESRLLFEAMGGEFLTAAAKIDPPNGQPVADYAVEQCCGREPFLAVAREELSLAMLLGHYGTLALREATAH